MTPLGECEVPGARARLREPADQHEAFLKAVQEGTELPAPAEVGMRDVAIVKAIYRASEERRAVAVQELLTA